MPGGTWKLATTFAAFGVRANDGAMNAAGTNPNVLTSAGSTFTAFMVGARIKVAGAGAAGADLITTVRRRLSNTQLELNSPALTTVAAAAISYARGVYRLSTLLRQPDVDGNSHQVQYARRLQIQLAPNSPGGKIFLGGPFVSPTSRGMEIGTAGGITDYAPGTDSVATLGDEYICTDTADQLINFMWKDDLTLSTPA